MPPPAPPPPAPRAHPHAIRVCWLSRSNTQTPLVNPVCDRWLTTRSNEEQFLHLSWAVANSRYSSSSRSFHPEIPWLPAKKMCGSSSSPCTSTQRSQPISYVGQSANMGDRLSYLFSRFTRAEGRVCSTATWTQARWESEEEEHSSSSSSSSTSSSR